MHLCLIYIDFFVIFSAHRIISLDYDYFQLHVLMKIKMRFLVTYRKKVKRM